MKSLKTLKKHLREGAVYRRADLEEWSGSVDRHLHDLVKEGVLEKLSGGLYYAPRMSTFGKVPADENGLLRTFLKDDRFVVVSPNDYNSLGVGTTQLYNVRKVYNYKRHGRFTLGNRVFEFVRKPYVPPKITPEFLMVDLANNVKNLAEDQPSLLDNIKRKAGEMDTRKLNRLANNFGTVATRKLFASLPE